jgi:chemotaxis protein MotA
MDVLSLLGVFFGFSAVLIGQFLEGGHLASLVNIGALIIVVGGTLGAVMVETPWGILARTIKMLPWIVFPPRIDLKEQVKQVVIWSDVARKQGLLSLETVLENETDDFIQKGLSLLIDGGDPKALRSVLEIELENRLQKDFQAAHVLESMGGYSPTIGIIGAVLGLIHVMSNLSDPSKLGAGIAVAFVATIYGVGFANLLLLPMGNKLHRIVLEAAKSQEIFIEGVVCIAEGESSKIIELKLLGISQ